MARPLQGGIARAIATGLRAAGMTSPITLTRMASSFRVPGAVSAGLNTQPTTYACEGFISSTRKQFIGGTQVQSGDVVVTVLGELLPSGVTPAAGDSIAIHGTTLRVLSVDVDGANAAFSLLTRG